MPDLVAHSGKGDLKISFFAINNFATKLRKMNYLKAYCNLIRKVETRGYTRKKSKKEGIYVEGHHIFPKSIFGQNKRIVYLTAREHYIAHALLEKIMLKRYGIDDSRFKKMSYAFWAMNNQKQQKRNYKNSTMYEEARKRRSKFISNNQMGENNPMWGKKVTLSEESRKRISRANTGKKPWLGKNHKEETKRKMSEKQKGRIVSEETKRKLSEGKKGICSMTAENKRKLIDVNSSYWKIIKPDGTQLVIKNLNEFCRQTGLCSARMRKVSKGIFKQHKGYKVEKL